MRPSSQTSAEVLAGAGLAWAVSRLDLLTPEDPFRGTLVVLPLIIAALRGLGRHAPGPLGGNQGGQHSPARASADRAEAAALGGLVLLTLGRLSLGLAATDWFLAAGYLLLLGHRTARLLLRWRPSLGLGSVTRPSLAFLLLPLTVYLAIQPWQAHHRQVDGDEPFYLLLTHSLVHDLDVDLADNYEREDWRAFMARPIEPQPGDPRGPDGEVYSRHNLLLPLLLAPSYLLGGRWGAMVTMALMTALLAWQVLRLLGRLGVTPRAAFLAYAVFTFSPPLLIYSYQIWIEVPAALVAAAAFERIRSLRPGQAKPLLLALYLVLLPLLKLRLGLVALPLAVLAIHRLRPARRTLGVLTGAIAAVFSTLLLYNQWRFGNPLKIHRWNELALSTSPSDFARGGLGMFYDVAFGLFSCAPIWLLLLPALWLLLRRRDIFLLDLAVVCVPYLATLAPRFEWYGGWSPPFRYPLVFLPFIALALGRLFDHGPRPGLRALTAGLAALTLVLTLVWIVVPGWTYNFADGRNHLLDQAGARLGADVARFFPSTVRPRPATWIWPLASLLTVPLALWQPARRKLSRRRAALAAGFAGLLLAAATVPLAVRYWPTRMIEAEDTWVHKERGRRFPEAWVLQRPRFPGGWELPPRGRLIAPLAPGGRRVSFRLVVFGTTPQPARLVLAAGDKVLDRTRVPPNGWHTIEIGPFEWPDAPLVLRGGGPRFPGRVAVDRIECIWE